VLNILLPDSENASSPHGKFLSQFSENEGIRYADPLVCSAGGRQVSFGSAAGSSYFFFSETIIYMLLWTSKWEILSRSFETLD